MPLQQLFTSRKVYDAETFVGQEGKLFYDEFTGVMRRGDGVTPGGNPIPFTIATTSIVGGIKTGPSFSISNTGTLLLKSASPTQLGGIKLGPGVTVNGQDQLIIDSAGLDFSFGDFFAFTNTGTQDGACLSSVNPNQDVNLVANGSGLVNVVGGFQVHSTVSEGPLTDVNTALASPAIFAVRRDGQVQMLVPSADSTEGAVSIIGGLDGVFQPPLNTGVMLHVTGIAGTPGVPSRIYNDSQNAFSAFVARRYNGTAASPTAVLNGEEIMRLSGTAHDSTEIPGAGNTRILYRALGNQTTSNHGGQIELWTTPLNSTTLTQVITVNSIGITMSTGTAVIGNLTGNADSASRLANSRTINGVSFNGTANINVANTQTLTFGTHLTGVSYNGSTAVTIATDATTDATANVLVARDSNGLVTAQNYKGNSRDAGTLGAGGTLTVNYATDHHVLVNITGAITIAHQNITAGRNVKVVIVNATIGNLAVNTGVADLNTTGNNNNANLNATRMGVYEFISYGTGTNTLYCSVNK